MVNHKLLSTPSGDFLGILGSSPAIFPPTPLEKVQAEELHRYTERWPESLWTPHPGAAQGQAEQGSEQPALEGGLKPGPFQPTQFHDSVIKQHTGQVPEQMCWSSQQHSGLVRAPHVLQAVPDLQPLSHQG